MSESEIEQRNVSDRFEASGRQDEIDFLKAIAILAVVIYHAGPTGFSPHYTLWDFMLRGSWTPFHVPTFLAISGFLYNTSAASTLHTTGRRLVRILVPYLIASLIWIAALDSKVSPFLLLFTGGAHPIYYYVFAISICLVLSFFFARLGARALVVILALLFVYVLAVRAFPQLKLSYGWYWGTRDPLSNFYIGYFLAGWLVRKCWRVVCDFDRRFGPWIWGVAFAGAILFEVRMLAPHVPVLKGAFDFPMPSVAFRIFFTLFSILVIFRFCRGRTAPTWVRFVSDATLTIFLVHTYFIPLAAPFTFTLHPLLRTLALTIISFGGSIMIVLLGQAILGARWSRRLIGS